MFQGAGRSMSVAVTAGCSCIWHTDTRPEIAERQSCSNTAGPSAVMLDKTLRPESQGTPKALE